VLAYQLDEGSGVVAKDASGHGNGGTLENEPRWTAAGKHRKAVAFDGRNDSIVAPDSDDLDVTSFTAMAWVNPRATGRRDRPVLVKEDGQRLVYALYASGGDRRPLVKVREPAGSGTVALRCSRAIAKRGWTHLAATYDGADLRIYVDGAPCGSRPLAGSVPASAGALRVGGSGTTDEWFSGTIDALQLFPQALARRAIRAHM